MIDFKITAPRVIHRTWSTVKATGHATEVLAALTALA